MSIRLGALTTILEPDEFLTEIRLPLLGEETGRHGGFCRVQPGGRAIFSRSQCGAALSAVSKTAALSKARVGLGGATDPALTHCGSRGVN